MLSHLSINNLAVVSALDIELKPGLTTITGETGAGKSIMVDAMGLLLGDRADSNSIRNGADRAELTACFDIKPDSLALQWLETNELADDQCILRRVISADGRSRAFINGTAVNLAQLKALGGLLIDIHSQHEHHSLLQRATHRHLLDQYAGTGKLAKSLASTYNNWRHAQDTLEQLMAEQQAETSEQQLRQYQLEEMDQLALGDDEIEQLEQELNRLSNADAIMQSGQQISQLCNSSDMDNASAADCLSQALKLCEQLQSSPEINEVSELLQQALINTQEAASSLNHYLERVELNPQRLQEVEQRLADIHQLARKHKVDVSELPEVHARLQQALDSNDARQQRITETQQQVNDLLAQYRELAQQLTGKRQNASEAFAQAVATQLERLGMSGTCFEVELTTLQQGMPSLHGQEDIEFMVSTNPGLPARSLNKVASGGELSRISLAIQVICAENGSIPTLVFDEVDVGIGGATAEVVGRMLHQLGQKGQVICVTHQPQVAAQGHHHLNVSKTKSTDSTSSNVIMLDNEQRVREIARMLGGIELTDATLDHAREMLQLSANSL